MPGALPPGALLPGTLLALVPGVAADLELGDDGAVLETGGEAHLAAVDSSRTSSSVALGWSRRTVNQPGCGAKVTTRNVPPAESRITVAASPAT